MREQLNLYDSDSDSETTPIFPARHMNPPAYASFLHWGMDIEQMLKKIRDKIKMWEMKGTLVADLPPTMNVFLQSNGIDRVLGADYINSLELTWEDRPIRACKYLIHVPEGEKLTFQLTDHTYPGLYTEQHVVVSEKILDAKPLDVEGVANLLKKMDFWDIGTEGLQNANNVRVDGDGNFWVVDTELKSFKDVNTPATPAFKQHFKKQYHSEIDPCEMTFTWERLSETKRKLQVEYGDATMTEEYEIPLEELAAHAPR